MAEIFDRSNCPYHNYCYTIESCHITGKDCDPEPACAVIVMMEKRKEEEREAV